MIVAVSASFSFMTTVSDLIVARLRDAGVVTLFGMPGGGSNLDLIDAAGRAGLPFVLTATETGAAIAALAQAEITGRPGACLTTLGPGVTSVVNGIACASLDRAPLLVFTDCYPSSAAAYAHQRLDHRALLAPVTKWSATLSAENADAVLAEAIEQAMTGPPGPVHIDVPSDVGGARRAALSGPRDSQPATAALHPTAHSPRGGDPGLKGPRYDRSDCFPSPTPPDRPWRADAGRRRRHPCVLRNASGSGDGHIQGEGCDAGRGSTLCRRAHERRHRAADPCAGRSLHRRGARSRRTAAAPVDASATCGVHRPVARRRPACAVCGAARRRHRRRPCVW